MLTFKPENLRLLLKQEFLTVPELEWLLFGAEHPSLQENETPPKEQNNEFKSQLRIKVENVLDKIEQYINDAVSVGKINKSPKKIKRRLLLNKPPVALPVNHWGYEIVSLLRLLQEKEYPISKELIQAIKDHDWDTAISKAQNLPKDMMEAIESDCVSTRATKLIPAPQGTRWEDVTIVLIASETVEIIIKDNKEKFSYSELGFSDKRKGDAHNTLWIFFLILLKCGGDLRLEDSAFKKHLRPHNTSAFNKCMQKTFGIDDSIFPHYKTIKSYKAKFKTIDRTQVAIDQLLQNLPYFP